MPEQSIWGSNSVLFSKDYKIGLDVGPVGAPSHITGSNLENHLLSNCINASSYGVKADGKVVLDGSSTSGSNVITFTNTTFTNADIGKLIAVRGAGAPVSINGVSTPQALCGYIATVPTTKSVTIVSTSGGSTAVNASATVANAVVTYGTPNGVAFEAALDAAELAAPTSLLLPAGITVFENSYVVRNNVTIRGVGEKLSIFKFISPEPQGAAIFGGGGTPVGKTTPWKNLGFRDFTLDTLDATMTSYATGRKHLFFQWHVGTRIQNMTFIGSIASCNGIDFGVDCKIVNNTYIHTGRGNSGSQPGGASIGIGTTFEPITINENGETSYESYEIRGNVIFYPRHYGIFVESQDNDWSNAQSLIVDNIVIMNSSSVFAIADTGSKDTVISRNIIQGYDGSTGYGIYIGEGSITNSRTGLRTNITDNVIRATKYQIWLDWSGIAQDFYGDTTVSRNKCLSGQNGIRLTLMNSASYTMSGLRIIENEVLDSNLNGIIFERSSTLTNLEILNNKVLRSGKTTVRSNLFFSGSSSIPGARIIGNIFGDDQASPTTKNNIEIAATGSLSAIDMYLNKLYGSTAGAVNLNGTGVLSGNISLNNGYTP